MSWQAVLIALVVAQHSPDIARHRAVEAAAEQWGVEPALALRVSHAENWTAKPAAVSKAGAVGIMQVMPLWLGSDIAVSCIDRTVPPWQQHNSLRDMRYNACVGVGVLKHYLDRCRTLPGPEVRRCALGQYNGATTIARIDRYVRAVENQSPHP